MCAQARELCKEGLRTRWVLARARVKGAKAPRFGPSSVPSSDNGYRLSACSGAPHKPPTRGPVRNAAGSRSELVATRRRPAPPLHLLPPALGEAKSWCATNSKTIKGKRGKAMADRFENIEDAQAGAWDMSHDVLTDDQLEAGGLVEVRAWVRSKASANALRQQRKREKQAEAGRAQVNVVVPEECKEPLKELAAALASGQIDADQVRAMIAGADAVAELDALRAERDQVQQQAAAAEAQLMAVRAELERAEANAKALHTELKAARAQIDAGAAEMEAMAERYTDWKAEQAIRSSQQINELRDRAATAEEERFAALDQLARVQAEAEKSSADLTAAEAERDKLRAALDAHTLRGRLARWLVGRV